MNNRRHTTSVYAPPRGFFLSLATLLLLATGPVMADDSSEDLPTYPAKAYSSPPVFRHLGFETLCDLTLAGGNPAERAQRYVRNELNFAEVEGVRWTHWELVQLPDAAHGAGMAFSGRLHRAPVAVQVEVLNQSERTVRMGLVLEEEQWRPKPAAPRVQWLLPSPKDVAPGERTVLRFPLASASPIQKTERTAPVFPAVLSCFVADSVAGDRIDLLLRDLRIKYGFAQDVTDATLTASSTVMPEKEVSIALQAKGDLAGKELSLELRRDDRVWWRSFLTGEEAVQLAAESALSVKRVLPWYLPDGPAVLGLVVGGYRCSGAETTLKVTGAQDSAFPKVERRIHNGRPTVFVDGEPFAWNGYASYDFSPGNVAQFGASGARVYCIPAAAGRHFHNVVRPTWLPGDRYDFGEFDEYVAMALQAHPDARLAPRVSLALPPWWLAEHPDSIARMRTPEGDVAWEETGSQVITMTSEAWREQQAEVFRAFLRHCAKQPWAERVIGFVLSGGVTEEWFGWGSNDGKFGDYSPSDQQAFQEWATARGYGLDAMPEPEQRQAPGRDIFPDTPDGRAAAAYAQFASTATAETIEYFARVVKEETQDRCLAGVLYGYVLQLAEAPRQHLSGNFDLQRVLASPDIDFLMGIPLHNYRSFTHGYDLHTSATESILAAGKCFVNENDLFSWLHHAHWYTEYNPEDPVQGATFMHRRVLANDAVHGCARQWFSLIGSWHADARIQDEFAREMKWQAQSLDVNRSGAEEVAFLVDDTSFAWYPPETALPRKANVDMLHAFGRTGAPVGVWLFSDVDKLPDRIRFVVVAHAPAAHAEDIAKLRQALDQGGRTFLLVGAVGLVDPLTQQWDGSAPARITGLPIAVQDEAVSGGAALQAGGPIYPDEPICPRATVESTELAHYVDGAGAMAARDLSNDGKLLWSGVPTLNNRAARQWLLDAGVHCYAPLEFTVHAAEGLVGITAPEGDTVTLQWPRPVRVTDWYTGWTGEGKSMECPFLDGQTRLFEVK